MDSQSTSLAGVVRSELINLDGVTKFSPNRRFATVYAEGGPADTLYFLESGLVKIYKRGPDNKDIMLQIIDQRWQDHLAEMDYLREGINLRAMGNQDPLVAYQREGFAMFGKLMDGINDDYLRYVFHVQVLTEENAAEPDLAQASYMAADDPVQGDAAVNAAINPAGPEPTTRRSQWA